MVKVGAYIRNLKRMKVRTARAVIGIAIGVFSVVTVIYVGNTEKDIIFSEVGSFGFSGLSVESENYPITETQLSSVSGVTDGAMPLIFCYPPAKLRRMGVNAVLSGAGANVCQVTKLNILHGRSLTKKEVLSDARVCVLSADTALKAYSRENTCGKSIILKLGGRNIPLEIIGVSEQGTGNISSIIVALSCLYTHALHRVTGFKRLGRL